LASVCRTTFHNMSSTKAEIIAAFDAVDAAYDTLLALPWHRMTRHEKQGLLDRLDKLNKQLTAMDRRLLGRLISEGKPTQFGGASWAEVLAKRLRISQGEAQRRIAEAIYGAPPVDRP
jgi:Domain of unknown function (DUF222)